MRGNRRHRKQQNASHPLGKRRWSRSSACISAAAAPAACASPCVKRATASGGNVCARPCAGGAYRRFSPKPTRRARPIRPTGTGCGAPPTACSTSPNRPELIRSRCRRGGTLGSDSTCLPLANGDWAYLCAYQDRASKQVVGWQVGATMPEELITSALQRAFWSQLPTPGLLVHADRGGQVCGNAYRQLLHDHQALRSQSRRGDCYDNAQAESLWLGWSSHSGQGAKVGAEAGRFQTGAGSGSPGPSGGGQA